MAAFGEWKHGAGRDAHSLVLITIGTGVGSGLILDGKLWQGRCGFAGEIGHITVNSGADELALRLRESSAVWRRRSPLRRSSGTTSTWSESGEGLTAEDVYNLAKQGDARAVESFAMCGYYLGIGLGIVINLLNPGMILLGGGVMTGGRVPPGSRRRPGETALPPRVLRLRDDRQGRPGERRRSHRRGLMGPRPDVLPGLLRPGFPLGSAGTDRGPGRLNT